MSLADEIAANKDDVAALMSLAGNCSAALALRILSDLKEKQAADNTYSRREIEKLRMENSDLKRDLKNLEERTRAAIAVISERLKQNGDST